MTRISRRNTQVKARSSPDVDSSINDHHSDKKTRKIGGRSSNLKRIIALITKISMLFGILVFVIYFMKDFCEGDCKPRVITPLPAPKLMDLPMFQGGSQRVYTWGTYRPNVYFGIRARTPQSLLAGLMWIGVKDGRYLMRHVCQDSDELSTYAWTQHNGRRVLVNQDLRLTTSFLKSMDKESGYGGDWGVRVEAQSGKSIPTSFSNLAL